jgi:hypothetical protein
VPLVADLVLRPTGLLPVFPGSGFLYGPPPAAGEPPVYTLCPWLTLAAVGAWARREGTGLALAAAGLFGAAFALAAWSDPAAGWPVKRPMNLSYALLALAVASAALAAARPLASSRVPEAVRGSAVWLGRHWLVYFYLHFAAATALRATTVRSPWLLGALQGAGAVAGTWVVVTLNRPLARLFRHPAAWAVLLAAILAVAVWPGLTGAAVLWPAAVAGLLFAANTEQLGAICGVAAGRQPAGGAFAGVRRAAAGPVPIDTPARMVLRLAAALALLAIPEAVAWLTPAGAGRSGGGPVPQLDRVPRATVRAAETPPPVPVPAPAP